VIINVDRSFLEINSIKNLNRSKSPGTNFKISEVDPPDFQLNKFFYKQIGKKHRWIDRLVWEDKKWIEYVENPRVKTFILKDNSNLAGYYETIRDKDNDHSEIAYFGILEENVEVICFQRLLTNCFQMVCQECGFIHVR